MVQKLAALAAVALLVMSLGSARAEAKGAKKADSKGGQVPDSLNWEEKVVGPKDKGVDHKKIAAMQEQARREDAARANEPPPRKTRAQGVSAPASATLPTMDIEKPAPAGSAHKPAARRGAAAQQEPPRQKDALDSLLAEEGGGPSKPSASSSGRSGLANVFASNDRGPAKGGHAKKAHRKHR